MIIGHDHSEGTGLTKPNKSDQYVLLLVLTFAAAVILFVLPADLRSPLFLLACGASLIGGVLMRSRAATRFWLVEAGLCVAALYLFLRTSPMIDLGDDTSALQSVLRFDPAMWENALLAALLAGVGFWLYVRARPQTPGSAAPAASARALKRVSVRQTALELGVILLVAWVATQTLHNFSNQVQLAGTDMIELTRSADFAGQFLRMTGRIPLWDPFIGTGEPMLEAVSTFVLNPFMSLPIMLLGVQPGAVIVLVLHAVLLGWGGWVWARVMGLGSAGRLLMGALLVGSGSVTGPLAHGTFVLAVSQVYMPYLYAGLIAMLYLTGQRWGLLLFVTATAVMIFSGTFWYVLPTTIGCGLIALFALIRLDGGRLRVDGVRLRALLLAGGLVIGVGAARLLTIDRSVLSHPLQSYDWELSYPQVFFNFLDPGYTADKSQWFVLYHFVVPAYLAVSVAVLTLLTGRGYKHPITGGRRFAAASAIFVLLIAFISMGTIPAVNAIYAALPFLDDWRNPGRMAAAASPFIVLGVSWGFDRLAVMAWRWRQRPGRKPDGAAALVALAVIGVLAVPQVGSNWDQSIGLIQTAGYFPTNFEAARTLRQLYPSQFLTIHTGWIENYSLNQSLIRHQYGDDEVFTIGLPATIGEYQLQTVEPFAFGDLPDTGNGIWLQENGYVEMPNVPVEPGIGAVLDYNPEALAYAYLVPESTLLGLGGAQLYGSQTRPATYFDRIDQIEVEVDQVTPGDVLVVQETAYPGWTVTVDGVDEPVESVNHYLAVRLPTDAQAATVVFSYRPVRLYVGGLITVISSLLLIGWALRLDRRWRAPELADEAVNSLPILELETPLNGVDEPPLAEPVRPVGVYVAVIAGLVGISLFGAWLAVRRRSGD